MQSIMKAKLRRTEGSLTEALGRGVLIGIIAELVLLAAAALVVSSAALSEAAMPVLAAICAGVCSFAGALAAVSAASQLNLPVALAVGASLFSLNFLAGLLLPKGGGFSVAIPAAFICGSLLAAVIAASKKSGKQKKRTGRK